MLVRASLIACLSSFGLGAASALAQDGDASAEASAGGPTGPSAGASAEALDAEARARFELGEVHLRNGRFLEAATEFEQAYELSHRYQLLFNVHVAYRDAGEPGRAAAALERFLTEAPPDLADRANLEARLESLRSQARDRTRTDNAMTRPAESEDRGPGPLPVVLVGIGTAALIGMAVTGAFALGISDDLASSCTDGVCPPDRESDANTGRALALTTDVLLGVGAAAVAVGTILFFALQPSDNRTDSPAAAAACVSDGCMAVVRGGF